MSDLNSWEDDPAAQDDNLSRQTQQMNLNNQRPAQGGATTGAAAPSASFRPGVNSFQPGAQSFQPGQSFQQYGGAYDQTGYQNAYQQQGGQQGYGYPQYGGQQGGYQQQYPQQGGYNAAYNQAPGAYNQGYSECFPNLATISLHWVLSQMT